MRKFQISMTTLAVLTIAGCGGDPPAPVLAPPPAGQGVQIKMTSTLEAASRPSAACSTACRPRACT